MPRARPRRGPQPAATARMGEPAAPLRAVAAAACAIGNHDRPLAATFSCQPPRHSKNMRSLVYGASGALGQAVTRAFARRFGHVLSALDCALLPVQCSAYARVPGDGRSTASIRCRQMLARTRSGRSQQPKGDELPLPTLLPCSCLSGHVRSRCERAHSFEEQAARLDANLNKELAGGKLDLIVNVAGARRRAHPSRRRCCMRHSQAAGPAAPLATRPYFRRRGTCSTRR